MVTLAPDDLAARARRIALVVSDVDGVLTDGTVWVSERGEELLRFSRRDGMGVERLRARGIATALLTRERSDIVRRRAEKLEIPHLHMGARDKLAELARLLAAARVDRAQVAYIGDDVNDLDVIDAIAPHGLVAAPADAMAEVRRRVHLVCEARGGEGAFRELADVILALRRNPNQPEGEGGDR